MDYYGWKAGLLMFNKITLFMGGILAGLIFAAIIEPALVPEAQVWQKVPAVSVSGPGLEEGADAIPRKYYLNCVSLVTGNEWRGISVLAGMDAINLMRELNQDALGALHFWIEVAELRVPSGWGDTAIYIFRDTLRFVVPRSIWKKDGL